MVKLGKRLSKVMGISTCKSILLRVINLALSPKLSDWFPKPAILTYGPVGISRRRRRDNIIVRMSGMKDDEERDRGLSVPAHLAV